MRYVPYSPASSAGPPPLSTDAFLTTPRPIRSVVDPLLPYSGRVPTGAAGTPPSLALEPRAVAAFDALLHELHPDAPRADPDRIRGLVQWLAGLPADEASAVLESRLRRVGELGAMLADGDWDTDEALRQRARKLLDYVDREDDLIPDATPRIGLLDDVLLVELSWPAFAAEVEDYLDFCDYRRTEHLEGADPSHRAAWMQERLDEVALWRHELDAHEGHYLDVTMPESIFRVS
jgi:hypothetical protein